MQRWAQDIEKLFRDDVPGNNGWELSEADANQITHPVLSMAGVNSGLHRNAVVERWATVPLRSEFVVPPNDNHPMPRTQRASFGSRHPDKS